MLPACLQHHKGGMVTVRDLVLIVQRVVSHGFWESYAFPVGSMGADIFHYDISKACALLSFTPEGGAQGRTP
jgi:hypothetical protein